MDYIKVLEEISRFIDDHDGLTDEMDRAFSLIIGELEVLKDKDEE